MRQQTMDTGHADVIEPRNLVTHNLGGDDCLLGYGYVAGAGRYYGDQTFAVARPVAAQHDGAGFGFVFCRANVFLDGEKLLFAGAGGKYVVLAVLRQAFEDSGNLRGRLALAKNHLRHADSQHPMVIDLGKPQILKREVSQAVYGGIRCHLSGSNLLQQLTKSLGVHESGVPELNYA